MSLQKELEHFCAVIGRDPLLVQGAGGNASWKKGDTLRVKASGTWLAEAEEKDIFVAVDLTHLNDAIAKGDYGAQPMMPGASQLRPSIETVLHALLPQKIVLHLHAVEALTHLVRADYEASLQACLGPDMQWATVAYHKPGAALAKAIHDALQNAPEANLLFLQNHGVVIGGDTVAEISERLTKVTERLHGSPKPFLPVPALSSIIVSNGKAYHPAQDAALHQLAVDPVLYARLGKDWALFPDHVVFLGPKAACFEDEDTLRTHKGDLPEVIFLREQGVFTSPDIALGKLLQLRCYYDVLVRLDANEALHRISDSEVAELLNWEAERYRQAVAQ